MEYVAVLNTAVLCGLWVRVPFSVQTIKQLNNYEQGRKKRRSV